MSLGYFEDAPKKSQVEVEVASRVGVGLSWETGSPESGRFQVDNRVLEVTVVASVPSIEDR